MASLASNKWYIWYLREVANGRLELPPYELNDDGTIKLYYGGLFCRVEDCSKAQKKYTATNNLRTHIKSHDDLELAEENVGGRVSQKIVDHAIKWYKALFSGVEPQQGGEASSLGGSSSTRGLSVDIGPPSLPLKKDGSVHVTNMRKKVNEMGRKIPCSTCGNRNDCCKDVNKCDHFVLFNCGEISPNPANKGKAPEQSTEETV